MEEGAGHNFFLVLARFRDWGLRAEDGVVELKNGLARLAAHRTGLAFCH